MKRHIYSEAQATLIEFYFVPLVNAITRPQLAKNGLDFGDPDYIWAYDDFGLLWMCDRTLNPEGCFPPTFTVINRTKQ